MSVRPSRDGIIIRKPSSSRDGVSHPLTNANVFQFGESNRSAEGRVKSQVEFSLKSRDADFDVVIHIFNRGREEYIINVRPAGAIHPLDPDWWDVPLPRLPGASLL